MKCFVSSSTASFTDGSRCIFLLQDTEIWCVFEIEFSPRAGGKPNKQGLRFSENDVIKLRKSAVKSNQKKTRRSFSMSPLLDSFTTCSMSDCSKRAKMPTNERYQTTRNISRWHFHLIIFIRLSIGRFTKERKKRKRKTVAARIAWCFFFIRASLPFGHSGTHVVLQLGALHPVRPHATEPENGPLRLLLQPASQAAARSAAL